MQALHAGTGAFVAINHGYFRAAFAPRARVAFQGATAVKHAIFAFSILSMITGLGATPAAAQASANTALAPGEVLLQISANGSSRDKADTVTILVPISTTGATASAARAANEASIERLKKALVARGVPAGSASVVPMQGSFGFIGNETANLDLLPGTAFAAAGREKSARSLIQIILTNPAMMSAVRAALDAENQAMTGPPVYALKDDRPASAAASADAIAKARRQADLSAAALGLRVARIVRVSNYGEQTNEVPDYESMARMMMGARADEGDQVVTRARVWIDFVLQPRG